MRLAMRIAFFWRPFYAHSRGVEGVAPEGRVRGARKVDAFSVAFFSLPRGDGTSRPQSFGSGSSPAGS